VKADGLAEAPLDPIPHHGIAERTGCSKANSRPIGLRFMDAKGREERAGVARSMVIDSSEIFRSQQPDTFRKTSDGALPLGADSELLAASRPAARQHGTAVLGLHAREEPVSLRTVTVIRLKGAFRHCSSST
jgi:hypothetical protein